MKERLKKILHKNKEILIIDYSNCKEHGMIELATAARELILTENKNVLLLSILNDRTYTRRSSFVILKKNYEKRNR